MKDEFYRETVTKIIISVIAFIVLVGGICAYMFWPTENEEIDYEDTDLISDEIENEVIEEENNTVEESFNNSRIIDQYVSNTTNNV